jgi:hypothetical protein
MLYYIHYIKLELQSQLRPTYLHLCNIFPPD